MNCDEVGPIIWVPDFVSLCRSVEWLPSNLRASIYSTDFTLFSN